MTGGEVGAKKRVMGIRVGIKLHYCFPKNVTQSFFGSVYYSPFAVGFLLQKGGYFLLQLI